MANSVEIFATAPFGRLKQNGNARSDDQDLAIRKAATEMIRRCGKSRRQIAEEMSALVGPEIEITEHMLNSYTAESKRGARFPAAFVPAFCEVTGDDELQRLMLGPRLKKLLEIAERDVLAFLRDCANSASSGGTQ